MGIGAGFPEAFASILRTRNAAPPRQEKSLWLASTQESPDFMDVAATMQRLFGSCGGAKRHDTLITGDAHGPLGSDMAHEP